MKEAILYEKLDGKRVRCQVCQRRCFVNVGKVGVCQTRLNQDGKLYSLIYGIVSSPAMDPVEKKPFYHFHPGELVFSIGTLGCNFRCKQCLNYSESWGAQPRLERLARGERVEGVYELSPQKVVEMARRQGSSGIAYTYTEPTIWLEFVLDCAKLAKQKGMFNLFVSNGSWTKETIDLLADYVDAANIDFKGFSTKTYQKQGGFFGEVPEMTKYAQEKGIRIEITTLVIPGINDVLEEIKKMVDWMVENLGPDTPWHLSRYDPLLAPDPGFRKIPFTSKETLDKIYRMGKERGLNFVYVWAPGIDFDGGVYALGDTICPDCGSVAIKRHRWSPDLSGLDQAGRCKKCGRDLNIVVNY